MTLKIPLILNRNKLKGLVETIRNLPWVFGERIFLLLMMMILLAVILGGVFFLKYVVLTTLEKPETVPALPALEKQILQDILKEYEARDQRFKKTDTKDYPNLFSPKGE